MNPVPLRPASLTAIMGHVKETKHVRLVEEKYNRVLVGYSARWRKVEGYYRTQIFDGQWIGVFPLYKDDLEMYCTRIIDYGMLKARK